MASGLSNYITPFCLGIKGKGEPWGERFGIQYLKGKHLSYIIKYLLWNGRVWIIPHMLLWSRRNSGMPSPNVFLLVGSWRGLMRFNTTGCFKFHGKGVYCTLRVRSVLPRIICKEDKFFISLKLWVFELGRRGGGDRGENGCTNCWAFPWQERRNKGQEALWEALDLELNKWFCRIGRGTLPRTLH